MNEDIKKFIENIFEYVIAMTVMVGIVFFGLIFVLFLGVRVNIDGEPHDYQITSPLFIEMLFSPNNETRALLFANHVIKSSTIQGAPSLLYGEGTPIREGETSTETEPESSGPSGTSSRPPGSPLIYESLELHPEGLSLPEGTVTQEYIGDTNSCITHLISDTRGLHRVTICDVSYYPYIDGPGGIRQVDPTATNPLITKSTNRPYKF